MIEQTASKMEPEALLERVLEAYQGFQTYCDEGIVLLPGSKAPIEFKTYFSRPRSLRFEFTYWHPCSGKDGPSTTNIVWSNGSRTFFRLVNSMTEESSLECALASATGISDGATLQIIPLIYPECINMEHWYKKFANLELCSEELDGMTFFHLSGEQAGSGKLELWLSKDDFRIRRIRKHYENRKQKHRCQNSEGRSRPFSIEYRYIETRIDEEIPDSMFNEA
ncbi:MAG: hypothetical protein IPM23_08790 [Candidatus Melainabacteria bacterium]|nr:hypothetical protein [Candidatus Melainabacteria bacterium]